MRIVIANGSHEADFIIKQFKKDHHKITIINSDYAFGEYISKSNRVSVFNGDPTKAYVLEDANVKNYDVIIALSTNDIENYVTCITAKKVFNIKRAVAIVRNPKRVETFKQLGIDSVISSTYLLGESIKNESVIDEFIKTISLESNRIMITEIQIEPDYLIANKKITDISFPENINISCIYRDPEVIIPRGDTKILADDKIVIVYHSKHQDQIIDFIKQRNDTE
ncbi:MAG: potassium channel family protein [Acholeplasmataceae bacterium]